MGNTSAACFKNASRKVLGGFVLISQLKAIFHWREKRLTHCKHVINYQHIEPACAHRIKATWRDFISSSWALGPEGQLSIHFSNQDTWRWHISALIYRLQLSLNGKKPRENLITRSTSNTALNELNAKVAMHHRNPRFTRIVKSCWMKNIVGSVRRDVSSPASSKAMKSSTNYENCKLVTN